MRPALLALVLVAACVPASDTPDAPGPTGWAARSGASAEPSLPPAAADTLSIATDTRTLAEQPTAPLRVEGACPFEGCTYRTWTTSAETTVYAAAGDSTSAAFTVPAGTALEAGGGFVLLTTLGKSVATRPTELFLTFEETHPLAEGDTLLVLDYEGEGSYRAWFGGRIGFSGAGSGVGAVSDADLPFRQVVEPEQQWWARVTTPDRRTGWLWMDRTPGVTGADALAG